MIHTQAFANTIQLHSESHTRRLFKARHHEMDKMEIRAQALTESTSAKGKSGLPLTLTLKHRSCTVYMFQIRGAAVAKNPRSSDESEDGEWLLTRRYSEFAGFRDTMLRLVRQWESLLEECPHKLNSREFELVSNSLRRPITPNFPRKHMRGDNEFIVRERRQGLRDFVRKLLDAYADMSVYFFNNQQSTNDERGAGKYLREIYESLEEFLQVPQTQKELERRHTAAVLALEDVHIDKNEVDEDTDHPERTCCICLDDYDCEADEDSLQDLCEGQLEALARDKMVKLPCGHHYHEDCVIEWFNTSVTCPLCRQPAVGEDKPVSFDVSLF